MFAIANSECGKCNGKYACANENTVQLCNEGELTSASFTCPSDHVCVSSLAYPCAENPAVYDCQGKCSGKCPDLPVDPNSDLPYSHVCLGPNTVRLCSNEGSMKVTCPLGEICTASEVCARSNSINLPVCAEDVTTTTEPPPVTDPPTETPATPEVITTTSQQPPLTPAEICNGKLNNAKYPLVPADPFCEKYVLLSS